MAIGSAIDMLLSDQLQTTAARRYFIRALSTTGLRRSR